MSDEHINGVEEVKETKEGLQQLLDPTYPLLQRFRDACPGTYHHSQMVLGLVEGVSLAIGLNTLKMKIASTYHDIGKMFNPKYFVENQIENENPHDKLSPTMSYNLITRHVSDSVIILINNPNFPRDIIEIISQHHGSSVLQYFYEKSGKGIEDVFRYKTSRPTSVESLVLMIADRVEASSRSLSSSGKFNPVEVIDKTIDLLLSDGELDAVMIKLGDLKKIKESMTRELEGVFSKRIDYDKAKEDSSGDSILGDESK